MGVYSKLFLLFNVSGFLLSSLSPASLSLAAAEVTEGESAVESAVHPSTPAVPPSTPAVPTTGDTQQYEGVVKEEGEPRSRRRSEVSTGGRSPEERRRARLSESEGQAGKDGEEPSEVTRAGPSRSRAARQEQHRRHIFEVGDNEGRRGRRTDVKGRQAFLPEQRQQLTLPREAAERRRLRQPSQGAAPRLPLSERSSELEPLRARFTRQQEQDQEQEQQRRRRLSSSPEEEGVVGEVAGRSPFLLMARRKRLKHQ
ncbi:hypothetical protein Esti_006502 [Eimeria stiedai]